MNVKLYAQIPVEYPELERLVITIVFTSNLWQIVLWCDKLV